MKNSEELDFGTINKVLTNLQTESCFTIFSEKDKMDHINAEGKDFFNTLSGISFIVYFLNSK